ncbi:hypothetical protein TGMAS_416820 [Toxoplasma gondii MAS]|uniref:Uncharacterized protein n=1 Tax=Toxoplasma gondii MAS TaxID=943118 RepID=A0A086PT33_TOXGO|nr:hypothetical protein TGMAS_416820 [Toxoplasma gondii MAS]
MEKNMTKRKENTSTGPEKKTKKRKKMPDIKNRKKVEDRGEKKSDMRWLSTRKEGGEADEARRKARAEKDERRSRKEKEEKNAQERKEERRTKTISEPFSGEQENDQKLN